MELSKAKLKRPALRYLGGKWRIASWIIEMIPEHRIYVEPYGGAASVLLRKERSFAEVYNDLDGELCNFFKVLRDQPNEFLRVAKLTPFAREEFTEAYEPSEDPVEQARRTLVKSFMGFGSTGISKHKTGFRAKGWRQRQTAADDWEGWPYEAQALAERLQGVVIENRPALEIIKQQDGPDTLHYIDSPYVHSTRGPCQRYNYEMEDAQHEELGETLNSVKGKVIISGYDCPMYDKLYAGWRTETKAALADRGRKRTEKVWMNF